MNSGSMYPFSDLRTWRVGELGSFFYCPKQDRVLLIMDFITDFELVYINSFIDTCFAICSSSRGKLGFYGVCLELTLHSPYTDCNFFSCFV